MPARCGERQRTFQFLCRRPGATGRVAGRTAAPRGGASSRVKASAINRSKTKLEASLWTKSGSLSPYGRGANLVPTAASNQSRTSTAVDDGDDGDADGHDEQHSSSAGGRKVAGSNPVAPSSENRRICGGFLLRRK